MGGVPALLLVIAAGITYGWQPDHEGGVEYIIQVPPDQVERLAQIGEISSVIDPEVRGHISRVIVRVGTGPIPKNTPANLSGRAATTRSPGSADLAMLDASPVPIPEMIDGNIAEPIPGLHPLSRVGEQSVLKPDANSPQGTSGYGLPALPPTLQSTSTTQIDQAGREITSPSASPTNSIFGPSTPNPGAAAPSSTTIRIAPPATRTPASTSAATPPPFTGSDPQGDYARARAGGPSTDPTNLRDNTWRDFPPPPSTTVGGQTAAGSTLENPFQSPSASSSAITGGNSSYPTGNTNTGSTYSQTTQNSNGQNSTGLAPGDTYGKLPSGFSFGSTAASSVGPDPRLTAVQVAAGAWSIDDATGRLLDRQGRAMSTSSWGSSSAGAAAPSQAAPTNQVANPNQNFASPNPTLGSGTGYGSNSGYSGGFSGVAASGGASSAPVNSSLGPPLTQGTGGFASQPNHSITVDRNQPLTRFGPSDFDAIGSSSESQRGFDARGTVHPTSASSTAGSTFPEASIERRGDPPSLAERNASSGSLSGSEGPREVVAPQPLFNGLLLISLVANVYLIFWLKNLRIQFRELVAAKRVAASSTSQ